MEYIILISIIFIFISLKDLRFSLGLIFLSLPLYQIRFEFFQVPLTLLELWIIIFLIIWLIKHFSFSKLNNLFKSLGKWKWISLAWVFVGLISIFIAPEIKPALGSFKAFFLEPVLLFIIGFDVIKTRKDLSIILGFGILMAIIISFWAISQKFLGGGIMSLEVFGQPKIWRATGPFPHPNFLGLLLGPILVLGFSWFLSFKNKIIYTSLAIFFVIILGTALFFAKSEGAIIGAIAGLFIIFLFKKPKISLISLVLILILVFSIPGFRSFVFKKATFSDLSGKLRLNIWDGAVNLLSDNFILGVGLCGYQKLIPGIQKSYFDKETKKLVSVETHPYPHNLFLALWLELGILGIVVFLWLIARFFYLGILKLKKVKSEFKMQILGVIGAMSCTLIHGLVDTPYFKNDLSVLFWFLILFMVFLQNKKESYY